MSLFIKRTVILKQVGSGYSGDGLPVEGVLQTEQYGDALSARLSLLHFAPPGAGKYVCILYDGVTTEYFDCGTKFQKNTPLRTENGFCALICFLKDFIAPVACGIYGTGRFNIETMIDYLSLRTPPKQEPQPPHSDPEEQRFEREPPQEEPLSADLPGETSSAPEPEYHDDALAEENYYETPFLFPEGDTYYRKVKEEFDRLFSRYPENTELCETLPGSRWVKVPSGEGYYLAGLYRVRGKVRYLTYAVPISAPPGDIAPYSYFVPTSLFRPSGEGYYVLFQDAETGEYKRIHFG